MSLIIGIALFVVAFVTVVVWLYNKYILISNKVARQIEIWGYILLFSVVLWEMVIKNILSASFYESNWIYLDQKLFALYDMLETLLTGAAYNPTQTWELFSMETSDYVEEQLLAIDIIEAILTFISTVCIAIGRFQDLRKDKSDAQR